MKTARIFKSVTTEIGFALFLVFIGVASRLIPHFWNFTAIGTMALFSAFSIRTHRFLILIPFISLAISDLFLMGYSGQIYVYFGFAAGMILSFIYFMNHESMNLTSRALSLTGLSVISSFLFFLITNFGAWKGSEMYTQDFSGLISSYMAGVPFLRNQIMGDLAYGALVFGLYEYLTSPETKIKVAK